ncbi:hypothetical protein B0T25DRAFT_39293 [Lasiosphaeria hispida]|uniref:Uncharacterized protein n=1 Tax=Lasiosphaeria hispida TaxID=260671 RepID=A0AAJ0HUZ3_9PEZI|nr:hypothetical protein B0T25DRAFT_39293 [Lasiosphaeria hispida]
MWFRTNSAGEACTRLRLLPRFLSAARRGWAGNRLFSFVSPAGFAKDSSQAGTGRAGCIASSSRGSRTAIQVPETAGVALRECHFLLHDASVEASIDAVAQTIPFMRPRGSRGRECASRDKRGPLFEQRQGDRGFGQRGGIAPCQNRPIGIDGFLRLINDWSGVSSLLMYCQRTHFLDPFLALWLANLRLPSAPQPPHFFESRHWARRPASTQSHPEPRRQSSR